MVATQDNAYKALFSHPALMRDLLCHFVREAWVDSIDFESFEKVGSNLVGSDLRNRDSDLIWRFRLSGQWLYVYLLLEFQSRDDYWMAQRIAVYRHLLYEDLRRNGAVKARGLLPRVCPIVLYTGRPSWRAKRDIAELLTPAPPGMTAHGPTGNYLLIALVPLARAARRAGAIAPDNLAAVVAGIEAATGPQEIQRLAEILTRLLPGPRFETLGQVFTSWINLIVANRGGMGENFIPFKDLSEVAGMGNVAETWAHRWARKGIRKGHREGLREGRVELLERQLVHRYRDPLPDWARQRLRAADAAQLDAWAEAIFDAPTLEALLERE